MRWFICKLETKRSYQSEPPHGNFVFPLQTKHSVDVILSPFLVASVDMRLTSSRSSSSRAIAATVSSTLFLSPQIFTEMPGDSRPPASILRDEPMPAGLYGGEDQWEDLAAFPVAI